MSGLSNTNGPRWAAMDVGSAVPHRAPSLAEQIHDTLRSWIIAGDLAPGDLVSENDLARRMSVSRSPLREAVRRLQEEGLLSSSEARGFRVPPLTAGLVSQVYGVRRALEGAAAEASAPFITDDDVADQTVKLAACRQAMDRGDYKPFSESDIEFHNAFIQHCANPMLLSHIERIRGQVQRIIVFAGQLPNHSERSAEEHADILVAAQTRDPALLRAAMESHIAKVASRLVAHMEQHSA